MTVFDILIVALVVIVVLGLIKLMTDAKDDAAAGVVKGKPSVQQDEFEGAVTHVYSCGIKGAQWGRVYGVLRRTGRSLEDLMLHVQYHTYLLDAWCEGGDKEIEFLKKYPCAESMKLQTWRLDGIPVDTSEIL